MKLPIYYCFFGLLFDADFFSDLIGYIRRRFNETYHDLPPTSERKFVRLQNNSIKCGSKRKHIRNFKININNVSTIT